MSLLTKWVGLDPVLGWFKMRDYPHALLSLSPLVHRYAGDAVGTDYDQWLSSVLSVYDNPPTSPPAPKPVALGAKIDVHLTPTIGLSSGTGGNAQYEETKKKFPGGGGA